MSFLFCFQSVKKTLFPCNSDVFFLKFSWLKGSLFLCLIFLFLFFYFLCFLLVV